MSVNMRIQLIKDRLNAAFNPVYLDVVNESEGHRGHAGYSDGASHFAIIINAPGLTGLTRVAAHRKIYDVLSDLLNQGSIHALRIVIKTD